MHTTFAFLVKKPGLTTEEFISYYENHHIPLINRLAGPENQPLVYKRRYTHRDDPAHVYVRARVDAKGTPTAAAEGGVSPSLPSQELADDPGNVDFDVITEISFQDQEAMGRWMSALVKNGNGGEMVATDEEKFLWRERTRAVVVEEFVSFGG